MYLGTYYTSSDAETHTLSNLPLKFETDQGINWGFGRAIIRVESMTADTVIVVQTLRTATMYWTRYKDGSNWSSWYNNRPTSTLGYTSTYIASDTDLNTVKYDGKYQINNNTIWSSLSHTPASAQGGSILFVYHTRLGNDIIHQVMMCATGNIYYRKYDTQSTTWSSWQKISMTTP